MTPKRDSRCFVLGYFSMPVFYTEPATVGVQG